MHLALERAPEHPLTGVDAVRSGPTFHPFLLADHSLLRTLALNIHSRLGSSSNFLRSPQPGSGRVTLEAR